MSGFDNVVRPFQTVGVDPPQQFFPAGQPSMPTIIVRAGRSGKGHPFNGSASYAATFYMTQYVNEQKQASFGTAF